MRQINVVLFTLFLVKYSNPITKTSLSVLLNRTKCMTPLTANGHCTYIHLCKPILDLLPKDRRPLSVEVVEFIKKYACSSNDTLNNNFQVCCPQGSISKESDDEIGLFPPDVTNHTNLKLLPKQCGVSENVYRIIGGHEASLFEFTWMAHLLYKTNKGGRFQCAGTVINEKYILTAAHCVAYLKNKTLVGVKVGDYNLSSEKDCEYYPGGETICADPIQNLTITETIVHPNFNYMSLMNDIALIRVSEKINLTRNNISPICLPIYKNLRELHLDRAVVTGWGKYENRLQTNVLRKVGLNMVDPNECRRIYRRFRMIISYLQMCAGDEGKDACDGDSGGPLQTMANFNGHVRYVQFGVVSFGPADCGRKNRPGVYVKLVYYLKWILNNLKP